jgi:hypothetical protein
MTTFLEVLRRLFIPVQPLPAGIYHYQAPPEEPNNYRLHLRIERDGSGLLIVNAATVLHLNQTAAEYAYLLIHSATEEAAAHRIVDRYRVSQAQALQDYREFKERLETLITTPDLDPVTFLDFERREPYSAELTAPFRLDCALTYRLPEGVDMQAAPVDRARQELDTAAWQAVLDKAWEAGIPHVIFTGGEPTLRPDLFQLVLHAEGNGQVTGLISDGLRLADPAYLNDLLQTGLDHLLVVLQPEQPQAWAALENVLPQDLFTAVHLTITPENNLQIGSWLERLAGMGLQAVSLSAIAPGMAAELQAARDLAASLGLTLVWDLPAPYSALNPVNLEVSGAEIPPGAGSAWLYVEPDGDVLPGQGINRPLGNLLSDPWEQIWERTRVQPDLKGPAQGF